LVVAWYLAALVSVPEFMEKPGECVAINVQGLLNVLEKAWNMMQRKPRRP
jgi:hypothetical protein